MKVSIGQIHVAENRDEGHHVPTMRGAPRPSLRNMGTTRHIERPVSVERQRQLASRLVNTLAMLDL